MPLNTDIPGVSTIILEASSSVSPLLVKKYFLIMSSLNLPWKSFELFSGILSLAPREKSPAPSPAHLLLRNLQGAMRLPLSLVFELDETRVFM